jgi:hypothetical protein
MMALAERTNEDSSSKIQAVMEDLRRVENEVTSSSSSLDFSCSSLLTSPTSRVKNVNLRI